MKKRSFVFLLVLSCCSSIIAQSERLSLNQEESFIRYQAEHLLHQWEGENKNIRGLVLIDSEEKKLQKIAIRSQVRDFDSDNSNRDAHALEVLDVLRYPDIKFYSEEMEQKKDSLVLKGSFDFHGKSVKKTVICSLKETKEGVLLSGRFNLILTDFGIKLPAFMMVKIADLIQIDFQLLFQSLPPSN